MNIELQKQFEAEKGYPSWNCNDTVIMEYIEWLEDRIANSTDQQPELIDDGLGIQFWAGVFHERTDNYKIADVIVGILKLGGHDKQPEQSESKQSVRYAMGVDNVDEDLAAICVMRNEGGRTEAVLNKVFKDKDEFEKDVEVLSKYFTTITNQ